MDKIAVIEDAAAHHRPIGFCYVKPELVRGRAYFGASVRERRQIIPDADRPIRTNVKGEQYVIGDDLARGGPRSFTLKQITEVTTV